jgi:hypothetical protein
MGSWERKLNDGAQRLGCMSCGAHVLVVDGRPGTCQCCGEHDLRTVAVAEEHQHLVDDPRRRFLRPWGAPVLSRR